jgi:hypothetical protein
MSIVLDGSNGLTTNAGVLVANVYTVSSLPTAGTSGRKAFVSNALSPAFGSAVVGGGAVTVPVYDNGVAWIVG